MPGSFVHLHNHSDFSLLAGCLKTDTLLRRVKELGMTSVALTDSCNLYGVIPFYRKALNMGIKPIIGSEAQMAPGSRFSKKERRSYSFVLLAENNEGFANLIKLSSLAFTEGFHYRPRVDKELLRQYGKGLICLSGGLSSELAHHLLLEDMDGARDVALEYRDIFGENNYFIELQDHGLPDESKHIGFAMDLARSLDIPVVATNDIRYEVKDHSRAFEFMICLRDGRTFDDQNRWRPDSIENFVKSPEEMKALFANIPEAIDNTVEIANRVHVDIDFDATHLPNFEPPEGLDSETYMRRICEEGLRGRYGEIDDNTRERFEYEFSVIKQMGYIDYFLIVWDLIHHARERGIPVGPGRGSAAGSIIAYAMGITQIEPLGNDLIFERFLNSSRISMPDIDIDFCQANRHKVIDYVREKYGGECVAQIITFGTMKARGAIRDVGRVLNVPLVKVDKVAKLVPDQLGITLAEALKKEPELKDLHDNDPEVKSIFDIALVIEGMSRHSSVHAAGVVISDGDLTGYIPVCVQGGDIVTQYTMDPLEQVGMLKMDFLGLDALTIIDNALRNIKKNHGVEIDFEHEPMDDQKTFKLIGTGELRGVFQLESGGMQDLCRRMRPDCFEDVTALIALYRPGPLGSGMVETYVKCKHGKERPRYAHKCLEPILRPTHGVILYQEQVMRIASDMAGFSMNDADNLRKAMGKKKPEIMAKFKEQFIGGAEARDIPRKVAQETFEQVEYFAGYGFNKSHSAAYAAVTYRTAYLKAHYPEEFMAALMSCKLEDTDKVVACINDCKRMNIEVQPPDIQRSASDFTPSKGHIHFGLAAIKGVGGKAVDAIIEAREEKDDKQFDSIFDFCESVDLSSVNRKVVESLIKAGAFDSFEARRAQLAAVLDSAMQSGSSAQADRKSGQKNFFDAFASAEPEPAPDQGLPDVPEWPELDLLKFEKDTLGFYITSHPLVNYQDTLTRFSTARLSNIQQLKDGQEVTIGVMIPFVKIMTTKKGDQMARVRVEDLSGEIDAVIFSKVLREHRSLVHEDAILFIKARVDQSRETPQLIIQELLPITEAARKLSNNVVVKINSAGFEKEELPKLKTILGAHRGHCNVFLVIKLDKEKITMKLPEQFRVDPSPELLRELEKLLGPGHVHASP